MKKIINNNSISGTNDFRKFLQVLLEKLKVYPQQNENLLQVIQEEIEINKQVFKKSNSLRIVKDQSNYSTEVVDHIWRFIVQEELRQNPRQKLYFICLISSMCQQDEMLGFQIKQKESQIFDSILKWILSAWSYDPDDEEIKELEYEEEENDAVSQKQAEKSQAKDNEVNINFSDNNDNEQMNQQSNLKNLQFKEIQSSEIIRKKRNQFREFKKIACLRFSGQILGGLDIQQLNLILEQLNQKFQNLIEEDLQDAKLKKNNYQSKDPNNAMIMDVNESNISESIRQSDQRYQNQDEIVSDLVLKEKNSQAGENSQIQNTIYRSDNTLNSQQNMSLQSIDSTVYDNEFIIDCLIQIIKHLEEERVKSNHVDQCLLFTKSSSLRIEKIRKGKQDFQIVVGFKLTLRRKETFDLLRVYGDRNSSSNQHENLMRVSLKVNQNNKNSLIDIDLYNQKQIKETYTLDLGETKTLQQKWISLQIIFPFQQKENVQFIVTDFYKKSQIIASKQSLPGNYQIYSYKHVNVIVGDSSSDIKQSSIVQEYIKEFILSNQKNNRKSGNTNTEYLFKLCSLNFGKELKHYKLGNLTYINDIQQSYIFSQTISKRFHTLCLNIENPSNKQFNYYSKQQEFDQEFIISEFKEAEINDHFNFTERHEIKNQNIFTKLFKFSDKSSNNSSETSQAKSSWKINEMKMTYINVRLYQYNYPLSVLEKIGNMDIFYYILKNILDYDVQQEKHKIETKFNIMKGIFDIMQQFNYSHKYILQNLEAFINNLFNEGIINDEQRKSSICQTRKIQLESYNQFFIEKNGFILLQSFLKDNLDVFKEEDFKIADMLIKYYESWEFEVQMLYRCFVNVILNFDIISCLNLENQLIIQEKIKQDAFRIFNAELQKQNKIEYLLCSSIKYYLTDLYNFILSGKITQTGKQTSNLTSKYIQGLSNQNNNFSNQLNQKEDELQTVSSDTSSSTFQFQAIQQRFIVEDKDIAKRISEFKEKEQLVKSLFNIIYHIIVVKQVKDDPQIFQNQLKSLLAYLSYLHEVGNKIDRIITQQKLTNQHSCTQVIDKLNSNIPRVMNITNFVPQQMSAFKTQSKNIKTSSSYNNLKDYGEQQTNFGGSNQNLYNAAKSIANDKQQLIGKSNASTSKIRKESYSQDSCQNSNIPSETNYSNQCDDDLISQNNSDNSYCNQCHALHQIEKSPHEFIKLQYSLFVKEIIYIIRRLMVKTNKIAEEEQKEEELKSKQSKDHKQVNQEKQYLFRRQITSILVQNEEMVQINSLQQNLWKSNPVQQDFQEYSTDADFLSSSNSTQKGANFNLIQHRQFDDLHNMVGVNRSEDDSITPRSDGSSQIRSRKGTIQGKKKDNQLQQQANSGSNKIIAETSEFAKEYLYHNMLFRYKYLDIIMELKLNLISKEYQYQDTVQRYLIDIHYNFYEQFKQSVVDDSIQSKADVYNNFLNQLILRLGDNLVEMGQKSSKSFEEFYFKEFISLEKSPLNQKSTVFNLFTNKFEQFKYETQKNIITTFYNNIPNIITRKNFKRQEFLYFLKTIIKKFKPSENEIKFKQTIISQLIESYLYYSIKFNDNPRLIFEEIMAILNLFLYPSKLHTKQPQEGANTSLGCSNANEYNNQMFQQGPPYEHNQFNQDVKNTSPDVSNLDLFLIGIYELLSVRIVNKIEDKSQKINLKQFNSIINIIFIVEYILNYLENQKIDKNRKELLINIIKKFIKFGVSTKLIYNSDPALRVLLQSSFQTDQQKESLKQMQFNFGGIDQLNGGVVRSTINVIFMLIKKLQNQQQDQSLDIESLLDQLKTTFLVDNNYTQIHLTSDYNLNAAVLKERHFNYENSSSKILNPTFNKFYGIEPSQPLVQIENPTSLLSEHLSIYIFYNLLKTLNNQTLQTANALTKQEFISQNSTQLIVKLISQALVNINKQKSFENLNSIHVFSQKLSSFIKRNSKEISSSLQEYLFISSMNLNFLFTDEYKTKEDIDNQIQQLIEKFQENFDLFYQLQDKILSIGSNTNGEKMQESRSDRASSVSTQQSKISNEIQLKNQKLLLEQFNSFQESIQNAIKYQDNRNEDILYSIYKQMHKIIKSSDNESEGFILPFIYIPIVSSIDFVSSIAPLLCYRLIINQKQKFQQQVQELKQQLKPISIYQVQQAIDLAYEFNYMNAQSYNYDKIFAKKWNQFSKILESQKGVFYREFEGFIPVQTISKKIDIFGRRGLTYSKPRRKDNYKNHHQYQNEYFENQNIDENIIECDDFSEQYNSKLRECNVNSETPSMANSDMQFNEDIDTIKHEREKQVEDLFSKVQQPRLDLKIEGEYISLTNSYFGIISIFKSNDEESEIIFESQSAYKRPDIEIQERDDYQIDIPLPNQENVQFENEKTNIKSYKKYLLGSLDPVSKDRKKVLQIKNILEIYCQTYNALENSVEIYMKNNKTYFFLFYEEKIRKQFLESLKKIQKQNRGVYIFQIIEGSLRKKKIAEYQRYWQEDEITNFEYLIALNSLSSRSLNDINQYYVFPWVIQDYVSETIQINDPAIYRNLEKPLGQLNEERYKEYQEKFDMMNVPKYGLYGSHFSTAVHVIWFFCNIFQINSYYLIRLEPFSSLGIQLQSGKFDHPDRLFFSMKQTWQSCYENSSDLKELIPEFFFLNDFLVNRNPDQQNLKNDLKVNHVDLPPWAFESPHLFIQLQRAAIESKYVSENLHSWIDLIWGVNQQAKRNLFNLKTYKDQMQARVKSIYDTLQEQNIGKLKSLITQIQCFGTFPNKIFSTPHPKRNVQENYDIIQNFEKLHGKNDKARQSSQRLDKSLDDSSQRDSRMSKQISEIRQSNQMEPARKKYSMNIELDEKDNTNIFFQIVNKDIYFVKRDLSSKDSNSIYVTKSKLFKEKQERNKSSKSVKIEHKINERKNSINQYQNLFAFFDGDIFFVINQKSNNVELYFKFEMACQMSFSNQPLTIVKCINNMNSGVLVSVANSKIFLADFDIRLLKKSKEQLKQLHIRDNSVFKNIQILYGHYSPIILLEVCANLDIIVSVDQEMFFLIHNSDGKCIRKYKPESFLRNMSKMTISPDGYICILCQTEKVGQSKTLLSTLCLLDINCLKLYQHTVNSQDDEIIDMAFINYKSMVVCKKQKFEIWDLFLYHFIDAAKGVRSKYKKIQALDQCIYKNIGLFYDRNTLIIYFLRSHCYGPGDSQKSYRDQFISLVTSKKQDIISKLDWACM